MKRRKITIMALPVLATGLVILALAVKWRQTRNDTANQIPSSSSQNSSPNSSQNTSETNRPNSQPTETPTTQVPTDPKYSGTALKPPTGQLLNKHTISLSSSSVESSPDENSTCQTVSGATCDIKLTGPDGTIKYLGAKTVDAGGGANFYWDAKTTGLTTGKWKVEAVAAKDGQSTVSAADTLDVQA